jgi:hypothetical protein
MGGYVIVVLINTVSANTNFARVTFSKASTTTARTVVSMGFANDDAEGKGVFAPYQSITTTGFSIRNKTALTAGTYVFWYNTQKER